LQTNAATSTSLRYQANKIIINTQYNICLRKKKKEKKNLNHGKLLWINQTPNSLHYTITNFLHMVNLQSGAEPSPLWGVWCGQLYENKKI
jgi:hypothetical protein